MEKTIKTSYELTLKQFISKLKKKELNTEQAKNQFEEIIQKFVEEKLSPYSNIKYNSELAKNLLAFEDLTDIFEDSNVDEYTVRKHIRDLLKAYISDVNNIHSIDIKDKQKFGFHLESVGLSLANETSSRSIFPDGNVIVLTIGLLVALFIALTKK